MKLIYSIGANFAGGGIGTTSYNGALGFWRHGHLSNVIAIGSKPCDISKDIIIEIDFVKYLADQFFDLPGIWRLGGYQRFVQDNMFDYFAARELPDGDAFHGWSNFSLSQIKKARKKGMTTFLQRASSHQLTQFNIINEENERLGLKKLEEPEKKMQWALEEYELADYILIASEFNRQSFLDNGISEDKLIKMPFGVNLDKFELPESKPDDGVFRAIFVGSCQSRKGIHYLLDAWRELNLKNAELIVCGEIVPEMKKIIEEKTCDSVQLLGHVNVKEYFQKSDVFIFPSLEEGSALVSYEAMACGLPLIVTNNTGSIARDGKDGFIVPERDNEKLKEAILKMYDDRDLCREMGITARKYVEDFTWYNHGENLVKAYLGKMESK